MILRVGVDQRCALFVHLLTRLVRLSACVRTRDKKRGTKGGKAGGGGTASVARSPSLVLLRCVCVKDDACCRRRGKITGETSGSTRAQK